MRVVHGGESIITPASGKEVLRIGVVGACHPEHIFGLRMRIAAGYGWNFNLLQRFRSQRQIALDALT